MLRYKTETRPGLVALYDIRPGNGAGQFLQPRSPHGAMPWWAWSVWTGWAMSCVYWLAQWRHIHNYSSLTQRSINVARHRFSRVRFYNFWQLSQQPVSYFSMEYTITLTPNVVSHQDLIKFCKKKQHSKTGRISRTKDTFKGPVNIVITW